MVQKQILRGAKKILSKREAKREDLRKRLLDSAYQRIEKKGIYGLRAREITHDAGCSLGALYTAYESLEDLIIHVNSKTLALMGKALSQSVEGLNKPSEKFHALAMVYLRFTLEHNNLWRALFDMNFIQPENMPLWYREEQRQLLTLMFASLQELYPDLDERAIEARARTIFSAVHGIVSISQESRFISLTGEELEEELNHFVNLLVVGSEKVRGG